MPRLTNNSLDCLARSVPIPQVFSDLTLRQSYNQILGSVYYDLGLVCEDGLVATNQCVMAAASGFIRKLLGDSHVLEEGRTGRKQDLVVIHLPELDHTSVTRVVTCFTEGVVKLPLTGGWGDQSVKKELETAWRVLGIDKVDLEEIFKNTSVQVKTIEEEVSISQADIIVNIDEDDVPDRLQTLCDNGIISIGGAGERKRKADDHDWSPGSDEEKSSDDDLRDEDWKPRKSNRTKNVPIILPKRRKSYDPEPVALLKSNDLKETVIKTEPSVADKVIEESVIVKLEPTAKSVSLTALNQSAIENSNGRGHQGRRQQRNINSSNEIFTDTSILNTRSTSSILASLFDSEQSTTDTSKGSSHHIRERPQRNGDSMNEILVVASSPKPNTRSRSSRSIPVLSSTPVMPTPSNVIQTSFNAAKPRSSPKDQPSPAPAQPSGKASSRVVTVHPPATSSPRQSSLKLLPASVQPQATSSLSKEEVAEKRAKIDQTSFALDPVPCFVCHKSQDKDGRALNMKNLFYLRNHFAKCLYNSGKVFSAVPPGAKNTDENGGPKDEFGQNKDYMYKCTVPGCWLQMKKGAHSQVCYKVYAIHMVSQHGVMEKLLEEDKREDPQHLLLKIRAYENCEVVTESPKKAKVPMIIKVEGDMKRKDIVDIDFQESKILKKAPSNVLPELLVSGHDDDPDDPDDPVELSEIVQLPQTGQKFVSKTFDRTEDINVFRRFNTNVGTQSTLSILKPVQKRIESSSVMPIVSEPILSVPIPIPNEKYSILSEKYRLGKDGTHTCFLCHGIGIGTNSKDSQHLSFKNLIKLKEHYSRCIYKEGNMHKYVYPEEDNVDSEGKPIDEFGKINGKMYKCKIQGCWLQRKLGLRGHVCYKVYSIHMASQHGVLETILENDSRPFLKEILRGIMKEEGGKASIARCRFESCKDIQFKMEPNKRELKMHYSTKHFRRWFEGRDKKGLDRMPSMEFSAKGGTRATCERCSEESKKPIYIQGDNEAIMGHLVVKHDLLADALREAADTVKEARDVVKDMYPDQVTEFYMATLSSKQGAIPLNEDFMDKMFI